MKGTSSPAVPVAPGNGGKGDASSAQSNGSGSNGHSRGLLANTGVELTGVVGMALLLIVVGFVLTRRRES